MALEKDAIYCCGPCKYNRRIRSTKVIAVGKLRHDETNSLPPLLPKTVQRFI
jgi:hypothetical protein